MALLPRRLARFVTLLLLSAWAGLVQADTHALLIGVSRVDALPRRLWLQGPGNDVALMREALRARGVADERIVVLADGVPAAAGRPTREAISAALAALQRRVQRGDHVVLHLAGHGAQVPQRPGATEPDGLDEVFLTADVRPWDAAAGRLPQALYDDDVGDWIDALADRGATVLAVFDTCHAAGLSRDQGRGTRTRAVAAAELGVPPHPLPGPGAPATAPPRRHDARVLALAARAHESTGEEWLPRGAGLARARMHGVFSHAVAQALLAGTGSPQALLQAVRERYALDRRESPVPQVMGGGSTVLP